MEDSLCQGPMKFLAHQGLFEHGCCCIQGWADFWPVTLLSNFYSKMLCLKKWKMMTMNLVAKQKRDLPRYSLFVEFNILRTRIFFIFVMYLIPKWKQLWSRLFKHDFKFFRCKTFLALWYKTLRARTYPMTHECNFSTN